MLGRIRLPHKAFYIAGYALVAMSLPLSVYFTSVGIFFLAGNWLLEGDFPVKFRRAKKNIGLLLVLSVYLVHIVWLLNSEDLKYALSDLQGKLSLLALPLISATIRPFEGRDRKLLLSLYILALLISAVISVMVFVGWLPVSITDTRQISIFISHIRLALMVNLGIFCGFWFLWKKENILFRHEKFFFAVAAVGLALFIFILKSLTGLVVFISLLLFTVAWMTTRIQNIKIKRLLIAGMILIPLLIIAYSAYSVKRFYQVDNVDPGNLDSLSPAGNPYYHEISQKNIENGHYVWLYVCEKELRQEWNLRSIIAYDSVDLKGQRVRFTLIRYLTSKELRKDAQGVKALTDHDIKLIESGAANYIYGQRLNLYPYIYRVIWEIDEFRRGGNPSGHSVTQRWLYLKIAGDIIKNHFWFGAGTGDVQREFNKEYNLKYPYVDDMWRLRAHNQFLTFWISFGIVGMGWILLALILPFILRIRMAGYLGWVFFIIILLSMFNEDTLETHSGATFFAYFYSLFFLMNYPGEERDEKPAS